MDNIAKEGRRKRRRAKVVGVWGGRVRERRENKGGWMEREGMSWLGEEGMFNGPQHSL